MKVGFIGFGGAGYGLAKGLKESGLNDVIFYDKNVETSPFAEVIRKHAAETGAVAMESLEALALMAEIIFSCVTGTMAVEVARGISPFLKAGRLFVDVNTSAPRIKEEAAAIVTSSGASYVDAAMMGGIPTYLHRVPILASGPGASRFKDLMEPYGMRITVLGERPGQASSIKMFRSIFTKGMLALLIELIIAAERKGVADLTLASVSETMAETPFHETVRLMVTKGVVNAERMAHEMEEVVETIEESGLAATLSRATREKLAWVHGLGLRERFGGEIPKNIEEVLRAFREQDVL